MSNVGVMFTGGSQLNQRQDNDFYPTPKEVTKVLLDVCPINEIIWEPMCGNGAMIEIFKEAGIPFVASDITTGQNFFDFKEAQAKLLVTNPPFNLAAPIIEHAFAIGVERMALVLKATYWQAKSRHSLFLKHRPSLIMPLLWRPDFMNLGAPTMEVMWCVWGSPCASQTQYMPVAKPK